MHGHGFGISACYDIHTSSERSCRKLRVHQAVEQHFPDRQYVAVCSVRPYSIAHPVLDYVKNSLVRGALFTRAFLQHRVKNTARCRIIIPTTLFKNQKTKLPQDADIAWIGNVTNGHDNRSRGPFGAKHTLNKIGGGRVVGSE